MKNKQMLNKINSIKNNPLMDLISTFKAEHKKEFEIENSFVIEESLEKIWENKELQERIEINKKIAKEFDKLSDKQKIKLLKDEEKLKEYIKELSGE